MSEPEKSSSSSSSPFYDLEAVDIRGKPYDFHQLRGKVVLVVNVASQCGFTGQYKGIQDLYLKHRDRGLVVIAFPCNQFGTQEPGQPSEIESFCSTKFSVTFPLMEKIEVNGDNVHPVYVYLKSQKSSMFMTRIKWNFEKFLIDRRGNVVDRYVSSTTPESLDDTIAQLLAQPE